MHRKISIRQKLYIAGIVMLLLGLVSAFLIYRFAGADYNNAIGYGEVNGSVYPIMPEDSKKYLQDLELYNGKAGVLANEFNQWFFGLWHGKTLAFTVFFINLFISFIFFFIAHRS